MWFDTDKEQSRLGILVWDHKDFQESGPRDTQSTHVNAIYI